MSHYFDQQRLSDERNARECASDYLHKLFARAGKPSSRAQTSESRLFDLSCTGALAFKRRVLGLCGSHAVKTLDEVAEALVATNIAHSQMEAKEMVPIIARAMDFASYVALPSFPSQLSLRSVVDTRGKTVYEVTALKVHYGTV